MFTLLSLLACTPPKIDLDTALDEDRTIDEFDENGTDSGSTDGGTDGGGTDGGGTDGGGTDGGGTDGGGTDGGTTDGGTTDGGTTDGGGTDGGTTDGGTTEPEPEPDYTAFYGERTIIIYDWDGSTVSCEETIELTGAMLTKDWEFYADYYADAEDACPDCDYFYEIALSTDNACGLYYMSNPSYGGIVLGPDAVDFYSLGLEFDIWSWDYFVSASLISEGAAFDGWSFEYDYEDWLGYVEIEGWIEFPKR